MKKYRSVDRPTTNNGSYIDNIDHNHKLRIMYLFTRAFKFIVIISMCACDLNVLLFQ